MSFISAPITTDPTQLLDEAITQINQTLAANGYPDWSASSADLEVIILQAIASMAADVAQVAATVLPAIFRQFGTQLVGIAYENGSAATILSTWQFTSPAPPSGYLISGGTAVIVDQQVFYVLADSTASSGATSLDNVILIASQSGTAYNNLGISGTAQPYNQIDYIQTITLTGLSSGGTDQETDSDYQDRLAAALQLQSPRPIVTGDFAAIVQSNIAQDALGISAGRATAIDLYYPQGRQLSTGTASNVALTYDVTNGSNVLYVAASESSTLLGQVIPAIGSTVTGTGIPADTTVISNNASGNTSASFDPFSVTLSANATATGAAESLTFGTVVGVGPAPLSATVSFTSGSDTATVTTSPYVGCWPDVGAHIVASAVSDGTTITDVTVVSSTVTLTLSANATATASETAYISAWQQVPGCITTFVTDVDGNELLTYPAIDDTTSLTATDNATTLDELQTWLQGLSSFNLLSFVTNPTYQTIYVTATFVPLPGYTSSTVQSNVQTALLNYLTPANWGNPNSASTGSTNWLNSTGGYNVIRYNSLMGVANQAQGVAYISALTVGTSPSPSSTSDVMMIGPAPLPISSGSTIVVTAA